MANSGNPAGKPQKVPEGRVNARILELIGQGILLDKNGVENLWIAIFKEFPANRPNKKSFSRRISRIVWGKKEIDRALQEIVRETAFMRADPVKEFQRVHPYIPAKMVASRAKWHRGLVSGISRRLMGKNLPGIGRIDLSAAMPEFKMPKTSFDKPFEIKTPNPENFSLMYLNGADFGIKYGADIKGNIARRALSDAEERKDSAVILTNIICLDLKKAGGPAKASRAQIYGDNIKPELIQDENYRKIVERILNESPMNELIYRTPEELLNDILGGWNKVCLEPNKKPSYGGPIYVVFGLNEKALITAVTYWEIRWWTLKEQEELRGQLAIVRSVRKAAKKRLKEFEEEGLFREAKKEYKAIQKLNKEFDSLMYQLARTTISDVANREFQRFFDYARGVVVQKIETAIPNSTVIGQGTNFIKIGGKTGEVNIPSHMRVTESLLHDYAVSYGPKVLREKLADFTVICHPWAIQHRVTARESDRDGKRRSMNVFVAPTAVDEYFLRGELDSSYIKDHPLIKAIHNETFKAGVLRLRCANGLINAEEISINALESFKNYPILRKSPSNGSVYRRGPKYIYIMCCSDPHYGGRAREYITDKKRSIRVGVAEATFELMRRAGLCDGEKMPVHIFVIPDDPTQGQNVEYKNRPHPHQMPYWLIEKMTGEFLLEAEQAKNKEGVLAAAKKIRELSLYQIEKRGSDYLLEQMMQMMERHIEPNLDVFSAILRRAQKANLVVKGVGEIILPEYGGYDSRNMGVLNVGSGNHFSKTIDFALLEGPLYAQKLRDLLAGLREWSKSKDLLKKLVVSPVYGSSSMGWGIISVKGKHEYSFEMRSAPTNMQGWGDVLRGHVRTDVQRGNYSRIFNHRLPVIKIFGDKHFFGGASTSYAVYHLAPAAVHTDEYGEMGFPPNNTGVSFIGVPADGPDSGPIIWRFLPFDAIKSFIEENPRPFDWSDFLPNPA